MRRVDFARQIFTGLQISAEQSRFEALEES
jgi:hypothetical protein